MSCSKDLQRRIRVDYLVRSRSENDSRFMSLFGFSSFVITSLEIFGSSWKNKRDFVSLRPDFVRSTTLEMSPQFPDLSAHLGFIHAIKVKRF